MTKKPPSHIRVSSLERTLDFVESVIEEMENEDARNAAAFAIKLIRKQYGLLTENHDGQQAQ